MSGDAHNKRKYCAICRKQFYHVLYKFPKSSEQREKWVKETGLNPQGAYIDTRICHIHFDDFTWKWQLSNGKVLKTLKDDAVPTLFVGENAPDPDTECAIPHLSYSNVRTVRCAICSCKCRRLEALPIFDKHDYYTEFGVALAIILKITTRIVTSRYSCKKCSMAVLKCYKGIVDINLSTLLSTRSRQRQRSHEQKKAPNNQESTDEDDDDLSLTEVAGKLKRSKLNVLTDIKESLNEKCNKCDEVFDNIDLLTSHFLKHLFQENREVFRRSVAATQVDEMDIEMASNDDELEKLIKKETASPEKKLEKVELKASKNDSDDSASESENILKDEQPETLKEINLTDSHENGVKIDEDDFSPDELDDDDDYVPEAEETDAIEESAIDLDGHTTEEGKPKRGKGRIVSDSLDFRNRNKVRKRRVGSLSGETKSAPKRLWKEPDIPGPRVCYLCGMTLKSHRTYITHMERHKNPEKFNKTCHLCGKRRVNIAQHVRLCRKDKALEAKERDYPDRKLPSVTCTVCNKKVCEMYLKRHLRAHEIDDDVARNGSVALEKYLQTCTLCGRRIKHLSSHMMQHQKKGDIPKTEIQSAFDCDHCGATFNQRTLMVNHMVLKHGADPKRRLVRGVRTKWTCSVCKQEFLSYNLIRKHTLAEHNGVGCDLQCEVCGKKYNARTSYIFHINSQHLDYFKHRCKQCGQYFVEEVSYKDHCLFRCPAVTGGRRKRNPINRGGNQPRQRHKMETEAIRSDDRHPEQSSMQHYNNIYGSYDAVYNINHRYLQF